MSKILDDKSILEIMCNDADSEVEFDSDDDMEEPVFSELTPLDRSKKKSLLFIYEANTYFACETILFGSTRYSS